MIDEDCDGTLDVDLLSSAWYHTCGIDNNGSVQCWGIDNDSQYDYGQVADTPANLQTWNGKEIGLSMDQDCD